MRYKIDNIKVKKLKAFHSFILVCNLLILYGHETYTYTNTYTKHNQFTFNYNC